MVDTYTALIRLVQMATGSNNGLWGDKENTALRMIEQAVAGSTAIDMTGSNHTLTTANNATDESRNALIRLTGTPGTTRTLTFPDLSKLTIVKNDSDSSVIMTAGAGTSATATPGQTVLVWTDGGTNVTAWVIGDLPGRSILSQIFAPEAL